MKGFALLVMLATIGAAPPESYPARSDPGHRCDAGKAKGLVGRRRSPSLEQEALRLSGGATIRWMRPGTMVTMDYRPDRLDLRLDDNGRILSVNCG